jgi:hypothetical protein
MLNTFAKAAVQAKSELLYRANLAKHSRRLPELSPSDRLIVATLKKEGVFVTTLDQLALPSTPQMVQAVQGLLPTMPNALADRKTVKMSAMSHAVNVSTRQVTVKYPELFLWGLEERLLNIMENYIGLPVAYLGASIRRDLDTEKQVGTRLWHRDAEDRRTLKVIVYLNDVDDDGGPFEYIPRSLSPSYRPFKGVNCTIKDKDMETVIPRSQWKACCGPAGTVVITDTSSIFHHGRVPKAARTAVFLTYISRKPKRPEICKSRFSSTELLLLASQYLSKRQQECVLWESELMAAYQQGDVPQSIPLQSTESSSQYLAESSSQYLTDLT